MICCVSPDGTNSWMTFCGAGVGVAGGLVGVGGGGAGVGVAGGATGAGVGAAVGVGAAPQATTHNAINANSKMSERFTIMLFLLLKISDLVNSYDQHNVRAVFQMRM
jgi:hypothetical protein